MSQGKSPLYPLDRRLGEPQSRFGRGGEGRNIPSPAGNRTPVVQPVAHPLHDWAVPSPCDPTFGSTERDSFHSARNHLVMFIVLLDWQHCFIAILELSLILLLSHFYSSAHCTPVYGWYFTHLIAYQYLRLNGPIIVLSNWGRRCSEVKSRYRLSYNGDTRLLKFCVTVDL